MDGELLEGFSREGTVMDDTYGILYYCRRIYCVTVGCFTTVLQ